MTVKWPIKFLDYDTFIKWAREAFEQAHKVNSAAGIWPFETAFKEDFHFIGEDHVFTDKANKAMPLFIPKVQTEGIKIPGGEIAVVSYVRKSEAYQEEPDLGSGVWTLDRVRELPVEHPIVQSFVRSAEGDPGGAIKMVKQWFMIARFQATADIKPPVMPLLYGLISVKDDGMMGGIMPMSRVLVQICGLESASEEELKKIEYGFTYECCETLRQIAAIVYLEPSK